MEELESVEELKRRKIIYTLTLTAQFLKPLESN